MKVNDIKKSFCEMYLNTTQGQADLYKEVLTSVINSFPHKETNYAELDRDDFSCKILEQTDCIILYILREEEKVNENIS